MRLLVLVLVVGCGTPPRAKPAPTPTPYDPPQPTLRLPRHFTPLAYTATLGIDPAASGFTGHLELAGTLDRAASVIWLNARELTITRATADGKPVTVTTRDELLEVRGVFAPGAAHRPRSRGTSHSASSTSSAASAPRRAAPSTPRRPRSRCRYVRGGGC